VQDKINELKLRKAAGHDTIQNEHIVFAGCNLAVHLSLLFTAMVRHAFVPDSFQFGIIKPILKNKHGDQSNLDMYRGITLTPALSKLFEAVLLSIYGNYLNSNPLQFGFKKDSGCSHALFAFSESIKHYNKRGSKVYCAFFRCQ